MSKANILIVEDESLIAEELKRMVQRLGYTVVAIANRYDEALELLKKHVPDLVLLDIGLDYSDKDGIDLAHYINETLKIPFVYITANADNATVNRAKTTFPNAYILKPFNQAAIFSTLEVVCFNNQPQASIIVKQGAKNIVLDCAKIVFIKADNIYSEIYTNDNKKYLIRKYLKYFTSELALDFLVQVHRSYVINTAYIKSYRSNFLLVNDFEIPLGDAFKEKVNDLTQFNKQK